MNRLDPGDVAEAMEKQRQVWQELRSQSQQDYAQLHAMANDWDEAERVEVLASKWRNRVTSLRRLSRRLRADWLGSVARVAQHVARSMRRKADEIECSICHHHGEPSRDDEGRFRSHGEVASWVRCECTCHGREVVRKEVGSGERVATDLVATQQR